MTIKEQTERKALLKIIEVHLEKLDNNSLSIIDRQCRALKKKS